LVTGKKEEITNLAMKLANQELASGNQTSSKELLDALGTVASALERKAGGDAGLLNLATQVQKLVKQSKAQK
jgi:hypothetical protein